MSRASNARPCVNTTSVASAVATNPAVPSATRPSAGTRTPPRTAPTTATSATNTGELSPPVTPGRMTTPTTTPATSPPTAPARRNSDPASSYAKYVRKAPTAATRPSETSVTGSAIPSSFLRVRYILPARQPVRRTATGTGSGHRPPRGWVTARGYGPTASGTSNTPISDTRRAPKRAGISPIPALTAKTATPTAPASVATSRQSRPSTPTEM